MEEDIKVLEEILKVRKEQKEIIAIAGGYCGNCNPDIKALTNAIQAIKENKELKEFVFIYGGKDIDINNISATRVMSLQREGYIRGLAESQEKYKKILKDMIPKSKIQEKIEKINKRIEQYNEYIKAQKETDVEFYENIADTAIVQVLEELFEESRKGD